MFFQFAKLLKAAHDRVSIVNSAEPQIEFSELASPEIRATTLEINLDDIEVGICELVPFDGLS